eukprot:CAMPEP_0202907354 /NCGR_PEP_ID=MMETSP1392-20130828/42187_1 /ASSEMBLY_ACC=CAM_ASM_000868 /TAXON_ID=225041 /ORGANISM="Chlamydomonas chlamydogama, Strain SAG 11-48b" /LENGTH=413 /DNA_ID=CAMNT_0049596191 /DNA_START=200 /DNA_END=1441 /DNA_ORIENTATION=+
MFLTLAASMLATSRTTSTKIIQTRRKVILDHDGGIDDFIALMLLLSHQQRIELLAVVVMEADSVGSVAVNTTSKLLHLFGAGHVPVAYSSLKCLNPFPDKWRWDAAKVDTLPQLNRWNPTELRAMRAKLVQQPGEEYLADLLMQQTEPVTLVMTGPLTNLAYALQKHGEAVAAKIEEVWWMGGALRVPGNVYERHTTGEIPTDGSAEWNAFCDPDAMRVVWASTVRLVVTPLDATNQVPITPDHVYSYGPQADMPFSLLAGTMYSTVLSYNASSFHLYYAWDALDAACMLSAGQVVPDRVSEQYMLPCWVEEGLATEVVLRGESQGAILLLNNSSTTGSTGGTAEGEVQDGKRSAHGCSGTDNGADGDDAEVEVSSGAKACAGGSRSRVKRIAAVTRVQQEDFYRFVLESFKQ